MTPDSSWSTRWSNICSFFSSSFWKSSIIRAASRRLRSNPSCFSRRASAVIRAPFFSSSSRSFSSSTRLLSISFCMTVFSRSSCSRAATPADDRARTRCTSMYAIRIDDAGAAGPCDAGCWAPTGLATTTRSPTTRVSTPRQCLIRSLLERRADRKVERPGPLARPPIDIQTIIHPDGAKRRLPSYTPTRPIAQIRGIELGVEAVDVADVEERRDPQAEWQRDHVLEGAQDLAGPALFESRRIDRRDAAEFEGADRVRAAKVEAFEQRDFLAAPAGLVTGLTPQRQDVAEPDRLEIGLEEARLVELGIAPEAGEVEGEGGLRPLGRGRDHIPAVAGQGDAD